MGLSGEMGIRDRVTAFLKAVYLGEGEGGRRV